MSKEAVLEFCNRVNDNRELQQQLQSDIKLGKTLEDFAVLARDLGCNFSAQEAAAVFEEERVRRSAVEGGEHAETMIVSGRAKASADGDFGMAGYRRVVLSMDWAIGNARPGSSGDESVLD